MKGEKQNSSGQLKMQPFLMITEHIKERQENINLFIN